MRGLFDTPTLGPCTLTPRPFQERALERIEDGYARGLKRIGVVHATGTGKAVLAALWARQCIEGRRRVLCLAHTDELIQQLADKFDRAGVEPAIEQGGQFARSMFEPDAVIGSVATMKGAGRLMSFTEDYFDDIIVDEVHHSVAGGEKETNSYKKIASRFPNARILGLTASPKRSDDVSLGGFLKEIVDNFTIFDAWEAGKAEGTQYLCDLVPLRCPVQIDLRHLKKRKGDFTDRDTDERVAPMIEVIANKVAEHLSDRPTIGFWGSVRTAQLFAEGMRQLGFRAEAVWGQDPERHEKIKRYREGDLQILSNMNLLNEGFDVPSTAAVILGRPTKSWTLYLQQIGRSTRPGKKDALLIDFDYLTDQFGDNLGLVQPSDLIDVPGFDEELSRIAAELLQAANGTLSIRDAIEQAKDEQVERRKQYAIRLTIAERKVECYEESFSMQEAYFNGDLPTGGTPVKVAEFREATPGQINFLRVLGYDPGTKRMSRGQAGTIISYLKRQKAEGKSTLPQRHAMMRKGVDAAKAREMTKDDAATSLDQMWGKRREEVYGRRAKA